MDSTVSATNGDLMSRTARQLAINPDGTMTFTATGHNGLVLFPSDVPAGPSTTQYIGRIVYHVDPMTGVFTLLQESNNQRDVCAELSD